MELFAFGFGFLSVDGSGNTLEAFYPYPLFGPEAQEADVFRSPLGVSKRNQVVRLDRTSLRQLLEALEDSKPAFREKHSSLITAILDRGAEAVTCCCTFLEDDCAPQEVEEAYLKLSLLSSRQVKPNQLNLDAVFRVLPNVAWTSEGAIAPEELSERRVRARLEGRTLEVYSLDKFPKMLNYASPTGIRIGDGARVRLGAYVGEGTTIMHEGFINYNAGTAGPNMIEGRISAGVFVGSGSDLGGGCSTMGTLSGGNEVVISVGESSLIGANAGTGIPLGDNCTIEAGLYLTAGTKVSVLDENGKAAKSVKARELSGIPGLLFRRNSQTGVVEAVPRENSVRLNDALHSHN